MLGIVLTLIKKDIQGFMAASGMRKYVIDLDDPLEVVNHMTFIIEKYHTENRITQISYTWDTIDLRAKRQALLEIHWEIK